MDDQADKHSDIVTEADPGYHQVSFQILGDRTSPFVNLTRKKSAINDLSVAPLLVSTQTSVVPPSADRSRCIICYSLEISSLETEEPESWDNFQIFLQILIDHEPDSSLNGNPSRFDLAVKQFQEWRTTWPCLCVNCNAAHGKLIKVYRQMKSLEEQVKVYQAKFLNAIKLSKAISENEPVTVASASSLENEALEQLRTCLIGGTEKWEGMKEKWKEFVNVEKISDVTVKIENDLNAESDNGCIEPEPIMEIDKELFGGEVLSSPIKQERVDVESDINSSGAHDVDDNFTNSACDTHNVEPKTITKKRYKKGKFKIDPNRQYSMHPGAVRYRELRSKYPHLTAEEMKAHLRTLPKVSRKGKPSPFLPIEDLKQTKTNAWYIKYRKTYGKTMSFRAYLEMKRKELFEAQKVTDQSKDEVGSVPVPGRSNIGIRGVQINWEENGDEGKIMYGGVEIRKNEDGTFSCISCETSGVAKEPVKHKASMKRHVKTRHMELTNGHSCDKCPAKFFYHGELLAHIQGKHEGIQCEICGKKFQYWTSLTAHKKVQHLDIKPHVCDHCGKRFSERKSLTSHVKTHSDKGEREHPFICHVCGKQFIEKKSVKRHMKSFHPEEEINAETVK